MAVEYHVYRNDANGGPVDYSTPVATVSGTTWTSGALAGPSDTTYAVRAVDTATGDEESNVDMRARLVLDASGNDVTGRPGPCSAVVAVPSGIGGASVHWSHSPTTGGTPSGFRVYATAGASVDFTAAPAATVPYSGPTGTATLSGLTGGTSYSIGVRAYNSIADDGSSSAVTTITPLASGPAPVDSLAASAA